MIALHQPLTRNNPSSLPARSLFLSFVNCQTYHKHTHAQRQKKLAFAGGRSFRDIHDPIILLPLSVFASSSSTSSSTAIPTSSFPSSHSLTHSTTTRSTSNQHNQQRAHKLLPLDHSKRIQTFALRVKQSQSLRQSSSTVKNYSSRARPTTTLLDHFTTNSFFHDPTFSTSQWHSPSCSACASRNSSSP